MALAADKCSFEGCHSIGSTDLKRWRLDSKDGTNRWKYLSETEAQKHLQSQAEKYFLGLEPGYPNLKLPKSYAGAAHDGYKFLEYLQIRDGHWAGGVGGMSFFLPGIVLAMYITETDIPTECNTEMMRYIANHVNEDGGWGIHLEAQPSTAFATTLYYVTLRILGMKATHPLAARARERLLNLGGAVRSAPWGKYWLCLLNLYAWEGVNPVPPELWLLPEWMPFHPWRWWVHSKMVYLPIAYLRTNKCQIPLNSLTNELREEIYVKPYSSIDFLQHRYDTDSNDHKVRPTPVLNLFNSCVDFWGWYIRPTWLLKRANHALREAVHREDEQSCYTDLSIVNKGFNMAMTHFLDGEGPTYKKKHQENTAPYLWLGPDGLQCSGTTGAQTWDTILTIIAVVEAGLVTQIEYRGSMQKALEFLETQQFRENLSNPHRQQCKGGWPYSTRSNSYIVPDSSAEAMKAIILLQEEFNFPKIISNDRLEDCVDTLLAFQNPDGGFGSYERTRGSTYLEYLNPSEIAERIMVEYSYPECSSSIIASLVFFQRHFPHFRYHEITTCIERAVSFVEGEQREDGSWYGTWGVCFNYGTYFSLEGLAAVGKKWRNCVRVRKACEFLVTKQRDNGGWGEDGLSCEKKVYIQHKVESQVVQTAWVCLGLMSAGYPDKEVIRRGLDLIKSRQLPTGEWLQESLEGATNATLLFPYPNYRFHFPIRALGKYHAEYLPALKRELDLDENLRESIL